MNKLAKKYLRPSQIPTKACHGCGIGMIENWLLQAIDELGLKQEDVIFGTGIGCVGRQTYATWGGDNFGATHGRALAVATGLKLAQPDKKYLIVVGDGDAASIGTSHLIHAARRNLGVTVICEDNMGYESTGGQFSPTTIRYFLSGWASLSPVATARARPWVAPKLSPPHVAYVCRPTQPIPVPKITSSCLSPSSSTACSSQFSIIPIPQP